jgi:hypothetical protein
MGWVVTLLSVAAKPPTNGVIMTATTKAPKSIDYQKVGDELRSGPPPHLIEFFKACDQVIADPSDNIISFQYSTERKGFTSRRELLHPLSDPLEDWLNSLVSGAALIALLIGILCLPSFTTTKTEHPKLAPTSQTESFLITQKPD